MHDNIHKGFSNAMRSYDQVDGALMTIRIDEIQKDYKCCGLTSYNNWVDGVDEENPIPYGEI